MQYSSDPRSFGSLIGFEPCSILPQAAPRIRMTMKFARLLLPLVIAAAAALAQEGAGRGAPSTTGAVGRGAGAGGLPVQPPLGVTPKSAIPNAKPVRSCESLASVALSNTTIESASADPLNPGICRLTAITTHPPEGDKVRIWIAIPTEN